MCCPSGLGTVAHVPGPWQGGRRDLGHGAILKPVSALYPIGPGGAGIGGGGILVALHP